MKHLIKGAKKDPESQLLLYWGRFYQLEDSLYNNLPFEAVTNRKLNISLFFTCDIPRLGCSVVCIYYQSS